MSQPGPPSPKLSSTSPLGKGATGGGKPKGASEEEQRPDFFGKDNEEYRGGKADADASGKASSAAGSSAAALGSDAKDDKSSRTDA